MASDESAGDANRSAFFDYETRAASAWVAGLTLFFGYVGLFADVEGGRRVIGLMSEHWSLMVLFAVVLLMIAGRLGVSLGLPGLFRDRPPPRSAEGRSLGWGSAARPDSGPFGAFFNSGAAWGGFGATVLVALIWTSIYYANLLRVPPGWVADADRFGDGLARVRSHADLAAFLLATAPPFVGLILLAAVAPAAAPGVERHRADYWSEVGRYLLGISAAVVFVALALWLGPLLHPAAERLMAMPAVQVPFRAFHVAGDPDPDQRVRSLGFAVAVMGSYLAFMVMIFAYVMIFGEIFRRWLSSGHAICIVGAIAVVAYSIAFALNSAAQLPAFLAAGTLVVLMNCSPYKYRYPGLDTYRSEPLILADLRPEAETGDIGMLTGPATLEAWWLNSARARLREASESNCASTIRDATGQPVPIDPDDLAAALKLETFRELRDWWRKSGLELPRLVVVAVTGAAYRSAFWTATVLDELTDTLPDLARQIRLFAGASGGMVGAAYHAAMVDDSGLPAGSVVDRLRAETGLDSLSPVVRRLLSRDLPLGLLAFRQGRDRGVVLEEQWKTLDRTFADLRAGEAQGWRPSLIVSPLVVETGRRLLISNLDLRCLADIRPEPGEPVYSRPAAEFFRVFRRSYDDFRVRTAIRMNATFPYISPAVSLPTRPHRRVVDAGYYDNYGVDLACSWAYAHGRWINEHTSGMALIQVRAYPSEEVRKRYLDPHPDAVDGNLIARSIRVALECLTTPPEAAGSARSWSMSYRNDEEIRTLDDVFHHYHKRPRRFFETFVFENPLGFAMNWFLSDEDLADMAYCIGRGKTRAGGREPDRIEHLKKIARANLDEKQKLAKWWAEARG